MPLSIDVECKYIILEHLNDLYSLHSYFSSKHFIAVFVWIYEDCAIDVSKSSLRKIFSSSYAVSLNGFTIFHNETLKQLSSDPSDFRSCLE